MIIPSIDISSSSWTPASLIEKMDDWSLFGHIALLAISADQIEMVEAVLKRVGGRVNVMVQVSGQPESELVKLLNAGATLAFCEPDSVESLTLIPADRTRHLMADESPDQAIPKHHVLTSAAPTAERIAELEMARVDMLVDVGLLAEDTEMILEFFKAVLVSDRPDGLWATLIVDSLGIALGLAFSDEESLGYALQHRVGAYHSRSRDELWIKGESSGATQRLIGVTFDCDRDCLRFQVEQHPPGFCHRNTYTCFADQRTIASVAHRLNERIQEVDQVAADGSTSFTRKLATNPNLLEAKLLEEAKELSDANREADRAEVVWEAADVMYFSLVAMLNHGVSLAEVQQELSRRMNRVVRRKNKLESNEDE